MIKKKWFKNLYYKNSIAIVRDEYSLKPSSSRLVSIWIYSKPYILLPFEYINEGKC